MRHCFTRPTGIRGSCGPLKTSQQGGRNRATVADHSAEECRTSDNGQPDLPGGGDAELPGGGQCDYWV